MDNDSLNQRFADALNAHGYAFHQRVLAECGALFESNQSKFMFIARDYPIVNHGVQTSIDILMKHAHLPVFVAAECKRVNPAYGHWLFAKASLRRRSAKLPEPILVETSFHRGVGTVAGAKIGRSNSTYHVGIEIITDGKGDDRPPKKSGPGAIEHAVTQVLRGMNGYVTKTLPVSNTSSISVFVPVVFTTAKLYISDADLSSSDLHTGNISASRVKAREVSWLYYLYHESPSLRPEAPTHSPHPNDWITLDMHHARSVAVVSASGIGAFFRSLGELISDDDVKFVGVSN